ncbi:MAG: hypothetical protein O2954_13025, partial [bacterium]|nr:hypothetical protein [bacterium]
MTRSAFQTCGFLLVCGYLLVGPSGCASRRALEHIEQADPLFVDALRTVGLRPVDMTIRTDYLPDPDRLALTRELLTHPLVAGALLDSLVERLASGMTGEAVFWASQMLGAGAVTSSGDGNVSVFLLPGIPESLAGLLRPLVVELAICRIQVEALRGVFSPLEQARLEALLVLTHPDGRVSEAEMEALLTLARRVDRRVLAGVTLKVLAACNRFIEGVAALPPEQVQIDGGPVRLETPAGTVWVGGADSTIYTEAGALIVDLGGNDRYEGVAGVTFGEMPVSVCIDLGGDDRYTVAQARGTLGVGVLVDLEGDDRYDGMAGGQGSGIAGVGVLEDHSGNDTYRSDLGAQGF